MTAEMGRIRTPKNTKEATMVARTGMTRTGIRPCRDLGTFQVFIHRTK